MGWNQRVHAAIMSLGSRSREREGCRRAETTVDRCEMGWMYLRTEVMRSGAKRGYTRRQEINKK